LVSRDNLLVVTVTVVSIAVVVIILHEEVLVCAVGSESDSRDTEAGEETLEAGGSAEGAGVAPRLTVKTLVPSTIGMISASLDVLASPWIPLGPDGGWGGRGLELGDVETGGVAGGHCGNCPVVSYD
jgi:hypothetical protein